MSAHEIATPTERVVLPGESLAKYRHASASVVENDVEVTEVDETEFDDPLTIPPGKHDSGRAAASAACRRKCQTRNRR